MPLYRDEGIVLRTQKLGEADRIVTLLTRGLGKVRVVGKGVRRTKSRFGARLEPAMMVDLQCYEGRSLDTVTQAETLASWGDVLARDYTTYTSRCRDARDGRPAHRGARAQPPAVPPSAGRAAFDGRGCARPGAGARRLPAAGARRRRVGAELPRLRPVWCGRSASRVQPRRGRHGVPRMPPARLRCAGARRPWRCWLRLLAGDWVVADASQHGTAARAARWPARSCSGTWNAVCDRCVSWTDATPSATATPA